MKRGYYIVLIRELKKDEAPTLKELYDEKLRSYVGIRKIGKSAMFQKDGDIRLDKLFVVLRMRQ